MARTPVRFVCQHCGLDSSEFVNSLIRQEVASMSPATPPDPPFALAGAVASPGDAASPRIADAAAASRSAADPETPVSCARHPGQKATRRCVVCQKPICPKCMELFGHVCSPMCRARAEAQGITVPVYAGQKSVVEGKRRRIAGLLTTVAVVVGLGLLAYSGKCVLCAGHQIVFLHGGTLARHDLEAKREVWSRELVDKNQIADQIAKTITRLQEEKNKLAQDNPDAADSIKIPGSIRLQEMAERAAAAALTLYVSGRNIWVASDDQLVGYDWDTGRPVREIPLGAGRGTMRRVGNDLEWVSMTGPGEAAVDHIDLQNGQSRLERIGGGRELAAGTATAAHAGAGAGEMAGGPRQASAGLPLGVAGADSGKVMDPTKVAEQAQNLTLPARIALPAIVGNAMNQERTMAELNDQPRRPPAAAAPGTGPAEIFSLVPGPNGYVQFAVRRLEARFVQRNAMKAPPSKSTLNGSLTASQSTEVANEMLNEMQRSRGGSTVTEDLSRYQVTVRVAGSASVADWTGEIIGPPSVFPLQTVTVVDGGTTLVVLDKRNQKLWQKELSYPLAGGADAGEGGGAPFGLGPCVERGDSLYVFDKAVLTAFDLKTGNVRWRIPTVGVVGLYFDDQGMLYVNTTTANPEKLKYSRQIDINERINAVIMKLDPATGRTLWKVEPGGFIGYLSGRYIYTLQSHQAVDAEENPNATGLEIPSFMIIRRLNPANGRVLWAHYQRRAPLSVRFDANSIELVFKKEVQVLRFLSL
jgi:outer membrane protein assembly factor BamB